MNIYTDDQLKEKYSFDLYGRHKITQLVVEAYKREGNLTKSKFLDVGSSNFLMKEFLPYDDIYIIDPLITTDQQTAFCKKGDATNMRGVFEDNSFDFLASHDVFEHIYPEKRLDFVAENIRVSKDIVMITAPFGEEGVEESEIKVNSFYKKLYNKDHRWLIEHRENGLPSSKEVEDFLNKKNYEFVVIHNNDLDFWKNSFYFTFLLEYSSLVNTQYILDDFRKYYNSVIFPHDFGENSYRRTYVISKKGFTSTFKESIQHLVQKEDKSRDEIKNELSEKIFEDLQELVIKYADEVKRLREIESSYVKLNTELNQLNEEKGEYFAKYLSYFPDKHLHEIPKLGDLMEEIAHRDRVILHWQDETAKRDAILNRRGIKLYLKQDQIPALKPVRKAVRLALISMVKAKNFILKK